MIIYEIYIFMGLTILLFFLFFYKILKHLFFPFIFVFKYFKIQYYKTFSLNKIKKEIMKKEEKNTEEIFVNKIDEQTSINNLERIKKIFLKIKVEKQRGNIDKFEKNIIEILSIDKNNIIALEMLSNFYINIGKEKKAFSILKRLIQLDMKNHNAIWNLSKIYLELGEIDTAYILINKAIEITDNNYKYYITYADITYNKGELNKTIEIMNNVLKLRPNNVIYLDAIATLYEEIGEIKKSKSYRLKILDIEPNYLKAKEKLNNT